MAMMNDYAAVLAMVVENGRLEFEPGTPDGDDELEVQIEFECSERGYTDEETAEAVEYAKQHIGI